MKKLARLRRIHLSGRSAATVSVVFALLLGPTSAVTVADQAGSRAAAAPRAKGGDRADRIFINGTVWTGDEARPRAEALAVRGDTVMALGTTTEIRKLAGERTQVVDLKGRLVVPGFNDAHQHLMGGALATEKADLVGAGSLTEIQHRVAAFAATHPDASWLVGRGWAFGDLPPGGPHRRMLDQVVLDRPVVLTDRDGHTVWCNTRALVEAGVTRLTPDPADGIVVKDDAGEPTGLLKEGATDLVGRHLPPWGEAEKYRGLKRAVDLLASYGITSVQNASFNLADVPIYQRLLAEGNLKVRVYSAPPLLKDPTPADLARYRELRDKFQTSNFRFGAVKAMLDGVVDAKTAAMLEPYVGGGMGLLNWAPEEFAAAVARWDREGFQIFVHAIGDRAVRLTLDAFEAAAKANGPKPRRHRVEHVEVPDLADLPRFKALGVIASTQATFAEPDKTTLENFAVVLGPERSARADSFKLFDDAGAVQAFGSDWPVFSAEVLRGIYLAVTRQTADGNPPGGWEPQGRISTEAALRHYTRDAAYAQFEESSKGTLSPGKLADLVVLSEDILAAPPDRLLKAKVLLTVMGGKDTWRASEF